LKPSFFKNELLATSDPLHAWVFEGLWCIADREGRLEDRPRRIHLEINAGRAFEGTESSLVWLADNGFILRYERGGTRYIQIVNFTKHQNPHVREPSSTIPAPDEHGASTVPALDPHQSGPALSSFPLPDSPSPLPTAIAVERAETRGIAVVGLDPEAWKRWETYRREIRRPIKPASILAAQRKLAGFGADQAAVVENSIANSYQGLFRSGERPSQPKARGFCA